MPRSLAASTRPWPAMICFASSIKTGLQNPNVLMLFAICRICFFECVRALLGYGRNSLTGITSIFIAISPMQGDSLPAPLERGRHDVAKLCLDLPGARPPGAYATFIEFC